MKTSTTNLVVEEVDAESLHAGNVDDVDAPTQETEKPVENMKKSEMQIDIRSESPKLSDKCRKTLRLSSKQIVSIATLSLHILCWFFRPTNCITYRFLLKMFLSRCVMPQTKILYRLLSSCNWQVLIFDKFIFYIIKPLFT